MIRALHGAVGMPQDWDIFPAIHGLNLWHLLEKGDLSLEEAGREIARHASDGDTLIGYSMGGRLALHALLHHPRKWKQAIIISAHPGLRTGQAERRATDEKWALLAETDFPTFLKKWNAQSVLSGPPPHWPDRSPLLLQRHALARSFRTWSLGAQRDLRPRLPEITTPVRWIVGEQDKKFTALAQEAVPLLKNATLEIVPATGHRVPWEHPDILRNL